MNRITVLSFRFRRGFHVCRGYGRLIVGPARSTVYGLLIPAALMTTHGLFAQGNLNPPGAPGPTFKTLSQIEPRTPISSLPFTITNSGSYYVTTNLFGTSNTDGITISANHVALDLNGFALLGTRGPTNGTGVRVAGSYTNLIVRNGIVTGWWGPGVDAYNGGASRNVVVEELTTSANVSGGITVAAGSAVRNCLSEREFTGIVCYGGLISGCAVRDNTANGISIYDGEVRDCRAVACGGEGIYASSSAVFGCLALSNQLSGIILDGPGCHIVGNTCRRNNQVGAGHAGIHVNASASANRIEANHVTDNVLNGILVDSGSTNNVIIRNTVSGSGAGNYGTIPAGNAFGPIVTATGMITTNNPWANFSY